MPDHGSNGSGNLAIGQFDLLRSINDHVTQIQRLPGLDREVLLDNEPSLPDARKTIRCTGNERLEGHAAVLVGSYPMPVVLSINVGDEVGIRSEFTAAHC